MNQLAKIQPNDIVGVRFAPEQIDLIKRTICKGASDDELRLFLYQSERAGLDPLARQIYAVKRWDSQQGREVMSIQTSIDGFRLIAERTGKYAGQVGPFWCGSDGEWHDVWVSDDAPIASRVGVLRTDFKEPCWGVARFKSYAQFNKKDGKPTRMWQTMPDVMLAKCSEALALRKAFPQELSGVYTSDEMDQAANDTPAPRQNPHVTRPEDVVDLPPDGVRTIPDGDSSIRVLPKTATRAEFERAQKEMYAITDDAALTAWADKNANRFQIFHPDYKSILRGLFAAHRESLRDKPKAAASADEVPTDPEQFLKYADAILASVTDAGMLDPTYSHRIEPHLAQFLPPDVEEVLAVFRRHERRLGGD